ncbi:hypothetical protein NLJ89_g8631 [Agrocybe chaxingu]|uniref:Uncharacterized protein n=1 Tax=Agrocybe chaxingu TaxID=84603 RepID=A0A9W8MSK4_9AGAR|nr:hypothetical protein NLJ89_g8631 [Agrocybe chaxingu]
MALVYPNSKGVPMGSRPKKDFMISGGKLLRNANRDDRFPYIYQVKAHPLITSYEYVKIILIYVHDTDPEAQKVMLAFEDSLEIPLGPDAHMPQLGLFELTDGTILFGRPRGMRTAEKDEVICWTFDGHRLLHKNVIDAMMKARDDMLGDKEEMNLGPKGTYFQRLGQVGVKDSSCYSLTLTHQHPRSLVGPTAGGKRYGDQMSENERIKGLSQAAARIGMDSLKMFAPEKFLKTLKENCELNNLPCIGVEDNYAYPAFQFNLAPAVSWSQCEKDGLTSMGFFGQVKGHRDTLDSLRLPSKHKLGDTRAIHSRKTYASKGTCSL